MRTQTYPSDVTDEQWALIEPHIPVYPGGRPRTTDLRAVVDAVLYVLRTGCQWRLLPHDVPNPNTVRYYYDRWVLSGTWARINAALRVQDRVALRRRCGPILPPHHLVGVGTVSVQVVERDPPHEPVGRLDLLHRQRHLIEIADDQLISRQVVVDIGAGTTDLCRMHGAIPTEEDQITTSKAGESGSGENTWQRRPSRAAAIASIRPNCPPPRIPMVSPGFSFT